MWPDLTIVLLLKLAVAFTVYNLFAEFQRQLTCGVIYARTVSGICRSLTLLPLLNKMAVAFTVNLYIWNLPNVHVFSLFKLAVVLRVNL